MQPPMVKSSFALSQNCRAHFVFHIIVIHQSHAELNLVEFFIIPEKICQ